MVYTLRFFLSSKCSLFHNSNVFGSCVIHILYTGCAKIKKFGRQKVKQLTENTVRLHYKFQQFMAVYRNNSCHNHMKTQTDCVCEVHGQ